MKDKPFQNIFLTKELLANALFSDARIQKAQQLVQEAIEDHKKNIKEIRPPKANLKQSYADLLATFANDRGANLWYPYLGSGIGNGALVELADGSIKYDFICGIGVHYFGHSHAKIIKACIEAAISDTVMQGNLQQNIDSVMLTAQLIQASGMDHCFLTSSGAMANENALKIAFQKRYPAQRILAFERCFAGRTLANSQITDKPAFREGLPINLFVDYIPFFDAERPEESKSRALEVLKTFLKRYPNQYALMCFELIQGEGGFYSGTQEFYKAIMMLLKEHDIAIFADEVQSFGRTPELFAFQYFGLEAFIDIASIGKLSQVCATFFQDNYKPRPGLLSQTFTASTSAIKAGLIILDELLNQGYYGAEGKITKLHGYFVTKLEKLAKNHPKLIHGPFGIGSMIAFTPYDGSVEQVTNFLHRLFDAGVIGFIAGSNPARVRFLIPAAAVTFQDIDKVIEIIEKTLLEN